MTEADIVIVGAGSAGCVLAARLTEEPRLRVLLLEAGGEPETPDISNPAAWSLLQGSAIDWDFKTVPQRSMAGRAHPWPRGRVVGGVQRDECDGSCPRPSERTSTGGLRQALPGGTGPRSGPISFVRKRRPSPPKTAMAERVLCGSASLPGRTRSPGPIAWPGWRSGSGRSRDHNGQDLAGPTLNTLTIVDGRRQSVADAYVTEAVRARAGLDLHTGLLVDRLAFDDTGRVIGVHALEGGTVHRFDARRAVVLAAGVIGTPAILMRSGLGPGATLAALGIAVRRDLPGVGQNLQDHLLSAGNVYRARRSLPPTETQHSEALTYIHARGQTLGDAPDLVVACVTVPVVSETLARRIRMPAPGEGYTLMFGITHPRSRGHLTLASADPHAKPIIDPAYLSEPADRSLLLEALDWARRLGAADAYAPWRGEELLPQPGDLTSQDARLAFIEHAAFTHHHPIGTCRMGTDPAAVVRPGPVCRRRAGATYR